MLVEHRPGGKPIEAKYQGEEPPGLTFLHAPLLASRDGLRTHAARVAEDTSRPSALWLTPTPAGPVSTSNIAQQCGHTTTSPKCKRSSRAWSQVWALGGVSSSSSPEQSPAWFSFS